MSLFPKDEHLEIYRRDNSTGPKGPSPATIIFRSVVFSVGITLVLSATILETVFIDVASLIDEIINFDPERIPSAPQFEAFSPTNLEDTDAMEDSDYIVPSMQDMVYGVDFEPYQIVIPPVCNGASTTGASFHIQPSTSPATIQGIVPGGQGVLLTGKSTYSNGIIWFQAINESTLVPSSHPDAENQITFNQLGWIQGCFVREAG
jgi:hypothetical protein